MCGENSSSARLESRRQGSPPRVRGKLYPRLTVSKLAGITPACAGKTLDSHSINDAIKDHPRVCGENPVILPSWMRGGGSPPRVRGKPK